MPSGRYQTMLEVKTALELSPEDRNVWEQYINFYLAPMRQLDEARAVSQKLLELDPLSPYLQFLRGMQYCLVGRYDFAIKQFHNALELDPHYLPAYANLGTSYLMSGKMEEATQVMQELFAEAMNSPERIFACPTIFS